MKKLLLCAAVALIPAHVLAENTAKISGRISASIEYERDGNGNATTSISDNESRLWILGTEQLGNDLKLVYGLNSFVAHDYNGWATDDSYIGLSGNFGKVRVGRMSTPIHYMTSRQDAFPGNNHSQTFGRFTRFGNREISLVYDSNPKSGFSYRVMLAPGYNKYKKENRNSDWVGGLGLDYTHSTGFNAHYALQYAKDGARDEKKDQQVHSLIVGYDKNNLTLNAGFQYGRNVDNKFYWGDESADSKKNTNTKDFQITGSYAFGRIKPQLGIAYGRSGEGKNYKQLAFSTSYEFSKSTTVSFGSGIVKDSNMPKKAYAAGVSIVHNLY